MPNESDVKSDPRGSCDDFASIGEDVSLPIQEIMTYNSLDQLKELTRGWDGYEAIPINPTIIAEARAFIGEFGALFPGAPQVVPMSKGRLQFEWHRGNRTLEIEFGESSGIHYLKWDSDLGIDEEDIVSTTDRRAIATVLGWFSSEKRDADPHERGTAGS